MLPQDLEAVVRFHGHLCPGLLLGYRAAEAAAAALGVAAAPDEELVLIAENDSCSVDAFQGLLSTTFGKGNLIFLDYGKQVFTLGDRRTGRAIRVSLRTGALDRADLDREGKIDLLLTADTADLFHLNPVQLIFPDTARSQPSLPCARCAEPTMMTRLIESDGRSYCVPCARDLGLRD